MEDTSQMLSSPEMFRKFIEKHLEDYAEVAHARGKLFLPHMCGHLKDMLPVLKDMSLDGIEAVTPPPTGNCPVKLARKVLGSRRVLIGGIDATRFALSPPDEFERTVAHVLAEMRDDPRFVLGNEEIQVSARWENIVTVNRLLGQTAGR
jgi:uroporphyrinogen-III decarboxylase